MMKAITFQIRAALLALLILTVLTGVVYPLLVTAVAQLLFPRQANGSLIVDNGQVVGSALIGQPFEAPHYFWGRLSATAVFPYNAFNAATLTGSSGSNYGPRNPAFLEMVETRVMALQTAFPNPAPVPVDLVTASGSGLDPHISLAAATYQVGRVAAARGMTETAVADLVTQYTLPRQLGFLGEPRVNVLQLNLALDARQ
jgi:potassium-transporting ATPase KdpC subunit